MKIRIRDRLFVSLAGLVLAAAGAALLAQAYFHVDIAARVLAFIEKQDVMHMAVTIGTAVVLLLLGLYCFLMLFRRRKRRDRLVTQKTDAGDLSISIKALEGLVQKCIDKHEELHIASMSVANGRDGLSVRLRAGMSDNMNIPLAVSALQKQIKGYVTECSGLDVKEVQVHVYTTAEKVKDSVYTVTDGAEARKPEPVAEAEEQEDKRPVHQRLFGREDQLQTVEPAPEAPAAEAAEEAPAAPEAEAPAPVEQNTTNPFAAAMHEPAAVNEPAPAAETAAEPAPAAEEAGDVTADVPQDEEGEIAVADKEVRLDDL